MAKYIWFYTHLILITFLSSGDIITFITAYWVCSDSNPHNWVRDSCVFFTLCWGGAATTNTHSWSYSSCSHCTDCRPYTRYCAHVCFDTGRCIPHGVFLYASTARVSCGCGRVSCFWAITYFDRQESEKCQEAEDCSSTTAVEEDIAVIFRAHWTTCSNGVCGAGIQVLD